MCLYLVCGEECLSGAAGSEGTALAADEACIPSLVPSQQGGENAILGEDGTGKEIQAKVRMETSSLHTVLMR